MAASIPITENNLLMPKKKKEVKYNALIRWICINQQEEKRERKKVNTIKKQKKKKR